MKAGWESTILGNVIDLQNGFAFKSAEFTEEGHFLMRIANVQNGDISLEKPKFVKLTEQTKRFELKKGDILTSLTGNVGRVAEIKASHLPAALNQRVARIKPKEDFDVDRSYLLHFLSSDAFSSFLEQEAHGAAQANVSPNAIKEVPFALPPLEEQKRIVSILDEAFEGLDRARENAEANLKSARELFESQLNEYFSTTPSDWVSQKLNSITTKIGSGATPKGGAKAYKTEGIPLIRSLNVHDRWFKADKLAYIDDSQAEKLSNVVVQKGDVLLNITGASVARCCVAPFEYLPARVNQHVSIIRPSRSVLSPEFLALMLTSKPYKDLLLKTGEDNGSTRQALTKSQIQDLEVTFPQQLTQQEEAVLTLKATSQTTKQLNEAYTSKLQNISDLRQSLLQKAFAGELT